MVRLIAFAVLLVAAAAAALGAQTTAQIEAEPIVKLREGETLTPDQCLSEQELELIDALNALRRPTVGVERDGEGDDPAPFDPHYLVGVWNIEGVLPESPLAPSGFFAGTETVRHVSGCTYESTIEASVDDAPVTVEALMVYDRRAGYLVRIEDDSRGFRLVKLGRVGGDPGGYFSHHWEAAPITRGESRIRLRGRTYMTSPFAYQVRTRISIDGGPFVNFGSVWWERAEAER
ncbi:MAG: hypothetical protein J4G16_09085 [Acidobacteria bacterium]|nr:hypothetical protein [Acidobacteriota bacterium]